MGGDFRSNAKPANPVSLRSPHCHPGFRLWRKTGTHPPQPTIRPPAPTGLTGMGPGPPGSAFGRPEGMLRVPRNRDDSGGDWPGR